MKPISRTVLMLSAVSLFTDMASEMLYPILPIYLKSVGFSVVFIGVLEGIAEATAGLSKGYFGKCSDVAGRRVPFVQLGYALSALSKPMMAAFAWPMWIFLARTLDRLGKGIRTGARDALLSDEATPETKGKIFGFHRSMDTLGAAIGPALALGFLYFYPEQYKVLFLLAFIPGLLAIVASLFLRESSTTFRQNSATRISFGATFSYWRSSPLAYKKLTAGLLLFTLANSSDVFLLLKLKEAGMADTQLIGVYIFYNLIYAFLAFPIGILADKLGLKRIFVLGLVLFALVYAGIAQATHLPHFVVLFFVYAIYAAATEGISKAWISNSVPKSEVATAIGSFSGLQSLFALAASSLAGWLWYQVGPAATFYFSAGLALIVLFYLGGLSTPQDN